MDEHGTFVARVLDSGLRALAAATAVRQRGALQERGIGLPPGGFENLIGDTEVRLLHLAEALATGFPALFVDQVSWSRSSYAARGLPEEILALNLACLRTELHQELPQPGRDLALGVLAQAAEVFDQPPSSVETVLEGEGPEADRIRRTLLAVLEGRRDDALDLVLGAADQGMDPLTIETTILAPLLHEFGHLWQAGEIQIHEEHLGSRIIEEALVLLRGRLQRPASIDRTVVVSSVRGNLHDIGTRIVSDHFEADGWRALRFGADLPAEDLAQAAHDYHADLVALSVTMSLHVRDTAAVIRQFRKHLEGDAPPVLVGGAPFTAIPDLWKAVGADGCASDVGSGIQMARRLVGVA